jgi:hypothetical protein
LTKIPTPPLPDGTFLKDLTREKLEDNGMLEEDPYLSAEDIMKDIKDHNFQVSEWVFNVLSTLISTGKSSLTSYICIRSK